MKRNGVERCWVLAAPHPRREELAATARIAPLLAQVLLNRGVETAADAHAFLKPAFRDLLPPAELPGAEEAAEALHSAARAGQKIVIYGDYDVDGVTGTTILWHALRLCGAEVAFYIPSRFDEGYGLNREALTQIREAGANIVISVDCGVTAIEEAAHARALGLKLIITDHHLPKETLPAADVLVHPTAVRASRNPDLCGAAVALKVAWALAQRASGGRASEQWRTFLLDATAFAALGLVADIVPLTGENRIIATYGLRQLRHTQNPGLRALLEVSGVAGKASYDDYDVGFQLAPRLNAVGRLGHARLAVEMFTTAGPAQALQIARTLDQQNRQRQTVERNITKQAEALVTENGYDRDGCRGIVLASRDWHAGVIGIVASRMVDRFHRPTVMIALENGVGQGSGRSIKHFPLYDALNRCGEHLLSFGGHAMAAGLRVHADHVDAFRDAFCRVADNLLTPRDLQPRLELDDETPLAALTPEAVGVIDHLAPFGPGNRRVRLATTAVELVGSPRTCGKAGRHLQFTVRQGQEHRKAIAFGAGEHAEALADQRRLRLAFEPLVSEWQGRRRVELRVLDWKAADDA